MSLPATAITFDDYQAYLFAVNTAIAGNDWGTAFSKLAQAKVALAALPESALTSQQMTRFRAIKDLDALNAAITSAQAASQGGGGMGIGLFSFTRPR